jgi:hypothetical protein
MPYFYSSIKAILGTDIISLTLEKQSGMLFCYNCRVVVSVVRDSSCIIVSTPFHSLNALFEFSIY